MSSSSSKRDLLTLGLSDSFSKIKKSPCGQPPPIEEIAKKLLLKHLQIDYLANKIVNCKPK